MNGNNSFYGREVSIQDQTTRPIALRMKTPAGTVFVDSYRITSYSDGTEIAFASVNSTIDTEALSVFKTGITSPVGTLGDELRQYIVGGDSDKSSVGGGSSSDDIPRQFTPGAMIVAKMVNQESDSVTIELGLTIYEI